MEIKPGGSVDFSIIFIAKRRAFSITPYIRLHLGQQKEVFDAPMPRPAYVYPADCAFADERYVRTASDVAPFFKLAE